MKVSYEYIEIIPNNHTEKEFMAIESGRWVALSLKLRQFDRIS